MYYISDFQFLVIFEANKKRYFSQGILLYLTYIYYIHNEEISRFLCTLKAIITSSQRRFISSKEIFSPSRFYFSHAIILCKAREHLSHVDVLFDVTSTVYQQRSECKAFDSDEKLK